MNSRRTSSRDQSRRIAFCGLAAALSVVLMISGGLIPIATYAAPMAAALLLLPVVFEFGRVSAILTYAAAGLISLMLSSDKEAAVFYLFIGYYPVVKWSIDRLRARPVRVLVKLAVFNGSIGVMYALLCFVLRLDAITAEFSEMGHAMLVFFVVMLNFCLFLYDRLLVPLSVLYWQRIRPKLSFLRQ